MPVAARRVVVLTEQQVAAFADLRRWADAGVFNVALLHGVTGSGKTELYLRLADSVRQGGRGVLLLVPEIALTPSVAALFRRGICTASAEGTARRCHIRRLAAVGVSRAWLGAEVEDPRR